MERTNRTSKVGEIVARLREATKNGKLKRNFASPLYNSLQKYYETTEPDNWREIVFSWEDFESRMTPFRKLTSYEDKTAFAYKSRARRAVEVYESLKRQDELFVFKGDSDELFLKKLRGYWKIALKNNLTDEEKSRKIEVIQCRTYGSGFAALVISSDSLAADLEEEYRTIENLLKVS